MVTDLQQKAPAARWNYLCCAASAKGKRLPNEFLSKEDIVLLCMCTYMVCNKKCLGTHNPVLI